MDLLTEHLFILHSTNLTLMEERRQRYKKIHSQCATCHADSYGRLWPDEIELSPYMKNVFKPCTSQWKNNPYISVAVAASCCRNAAGIGEAA